MSRRVQPALLRLALASLALTTVPLVVADPAAAAAPAATAHQSAESGPTAQADSVAQTGSTAQAGSAVQTGSAAQAGSAVQAGTAVLAGAVAQSSPTLLAAYQARMRSYRIVGAARAQQGKPYRYGATGPAAFDCSGLTTYAYRSQHIALPRTADQQYRASRRLSRAEARPGDLVFWVSGGHAYHVAIYAGDGQVWHAPKPGSPVHSAAIWSWSQVRFGRFGK